MSCSVRAIIGTAARVPVTVNGVTIAHDLISREAQNHPAAKSIDAWQAAARALAVRELLLQEARRLGLKPHPAADAEGRHETDEEALIRGLIDTEVTTPTRDAASCALYYERNRNRFRSPDIYEASHILIAARSDNGDAYAAARHRALSVLARACVDARSFAELARTHSDCPSAASGGNLGQLTAGDTTPEFEAALVVLKPGETTRTLVETRYGFHVIRLEQRIAGRQLPLEAVASQIAGYLAERSTRLAIAQYIARLVGLANVTGVDLPTPGDLRVH
jgi:peptidyl-prolyl cis-trans isomerase C